jgi:hypothetical protein
MDLTKAYKKWEQDPDSLNPERKRSLPKRWKIKLQAYKNRKRITLCCICLNKFNPKDLTVMTDGGSGGICKKCKEKS